MTPGFITDILGFFLLVPPTRALLRRLLPGSPAAYGPARSVFFIYDRRPSSWRRETGTRRPRLAPAPGPRRDARRDYDFEGSAREIPDVEGPELERGPER